MTTREEDNVETLFTASSHDYILFFTSFGRVYRKKGYQIPEAGRTAKGTNIINIIPIEKGERVTAMLHFREFTEDKFLVMITKFGTVKRMDVTVLKNIRNSGIRALRLDENDELISVRETDGNDLIMIATREGMAICFHENDVRPMGREAAGVRGIKLRAGDYCVGAARAREGGTLLSVTENGFGKRTAIEEYLRGSSTDKGGEPQSRGGLGMKNYSVTEKTGKVAAVKVVDDNDDVMIISDDGTIIRMAASGISLYGRATQGVRLMRLEEGSKVISIARLQQEDETSDADVQNAETVQDSE